MTIVIPEVGKLAALDLTNANVCLRILSFDKHQLLEGMVVEGMFDHVFRQLGT